jgi:hypothetical protein
MPDDYEEMFDKVKSGEISLDEFETWLRMVVDHVRRMVE